MLRGRYITRRESGKTEKIVNVIPAYRQKNPPADFAGTTVKMHRLNLRSRPNLR